VAWQKIKESYPTMGFLLYVNTVMHKALCPFPQVLKTVVAIEKDYEKEGKHNYLNHHIKKQKSQSSLLIFLELTPADQWQSPGTGLQGHQSFERRIPVKHHNHGP
jgi:hypothetical protein